MPDIMHATLAIPMGFREDNLWSVVSQLLDQFNELVREFNNCTDRDRRRVLRADALALLSELEEIKKIFADIKDGGGADLTIPPVCHSYRSNATCSALA